MIYKSKKLLKIVIQNFKRVFETSDDFFALKISIMALTLILDQGFLLKVMTI
jgi:hypothetical protein